MTKDNKWILEKASTLPFGPKKSMSIESLEDLEKIFNEEGESLIINFKNKEIIIYDDWIE